MKKRILIINPNTAKDTAEKMEAECRKIAAPDTIVDATFIKARPGFSSYKVFSYVDLAICTVETIKIGWKKRHDYDGIIVAGFSDVGVDAMKEILEIPVLGIAEVSYHIAALLGHRFTVLTGTSKWTPPKHDYVRALGDEIVLAQQPRTQQLLGWYTRVVTSLDEYYRPASERLYRSGQG